jgi:hypothetical protein
MTKSTLASQISQIVYKDMEATQHEDAAKEISVELNRKSQPMPLDEELLDWR